MVPQHHPLSAGEISLERLASFPILTYSFGYTGRSNIESAFKNAGLELDIILAAADTDVIKTYVRLGMGVGLIAGNGIRSIDGSGFGGTGFIPSNSQFKDQNSLFKT